MVVKTCPTCRGCGYVELAPATSKGGNMKLAQVDVRKVLELLRAWKSTKAVAAVTGISAETVRVIGNGTWAGYRKTVGTKVCS